MPQDGSQVPGDDVGKTANELLSVLTAVMAAADDLAEGRFHDAARMEADLQALELALTRAQALVARLRAAVHTPAAGR